MGRKIPKNKIINQEPSPIDLTTVNQIIDTNDINITALRRGKVRELFRMGFEVSQMVLVLKSGITINNQKIKIPASEQVIRSDLEYIKQEDAAIPFDFSEKRAEILDKLNYLYNRAMTEYLNAKGPVKNSFLNTALSILNKIGDIEGVNSAEAIDININAEMKMAKFSAEVQTLNKEDKDVLITAIRQILGKREQESTGDNGVLSEQSILPAQTGNDEGIPRES
jgi:hypothetical protein